MSERPTKITFAEMREMGVRGLLVYCADYRCSHSIAISGDAWRSAKRPSICCSRSTGSTGSHSVLENTNGFSEALLPSFAWRQEIDPHEIKPKRRKKTAGLEGNPLTAEHEPLDRRSTTPHKPSEGTT